MIEHPLDTTAHALAVVTGRTFEDAQRNLAGHLGERYPRPPQQPDDVELVLRVGAVLLSRFGIRSADQGGRPSPAAVWRS